MNFRCTVRPKPQEEETFTSYILRVASLNSVNFTDLWGHFNDGFQKAHLKDAHQLDLNYHRVVNSIGLEKMFFIPIETLNSMGFSVIFQKFLNVDELFTALPRDFIQNAIITTKRRFCPDCLNENLIFKRKWQIDEIKICKKHFTELEASCPSCKLEIPYISKSFYEGKCPFCGYNLAHDNGKKITDANFIKGQLQIYKEWAYLLNPNNEIIKPIMESKRKSLAISLLFVLQKKGQTLNKKNITIISKDEINKIIRLIKDKERPKRITLPFLIKALRKVGMALCEFSSITVPKTFIHSILDDVNEKKNLRKPGPCLAPWCNAYKTTITLKKINYISNKTFCNGQKLVDLYACTECLVKYGFDSNNGEWKETEDLIEIGWRKIRPLLNQGHSKRTVSLTLGVSPYHVTRMIGYLCNYKLLNEQNLCKYSSYTVPKNIVKCFKELLMKNRSIISLAKQQFGWDKKEYWYY